MKVATVEIGGGQRVALVEEGRATRLLPERAGSLLDIIERGEPLSALAQEAAAVWGPARFLAPIGRPRRNIFCVGKNYHEHAHEFARSGFDSSAAAGAVPEAPIVFSKVPECVIGPGDAVTFDPTVSTAIDYEGELAVIIGRSGRKISKAAAMGHVWGYTIVNDVTARDVQGRLKQWLVGKSFDTFCPMGPWVVTADEIDLSNTTLKTWVNGELRQDANTRDLIFDVPTIIETISAGVTLRAGDIIATGTPVGVGIGFTPPRYMKDGDVVEIEVGGIGKLSNPVRSLA
jgi:2-keto-4-pentenoate hydratase/2-oxohepta-3-ene-1,7-dioic acid hydratase in catechol pathway